MGKEAILSPDLIQRVYCFQYRLALGLGPRVSGLRTPGVCAHVCVCVCVCVCGGGGGGGGGRGETRLMCGLAKETILSTTALSDTADF